MSRLLIFASLSLCFMSIVLCSYANYRLPAGLISQTLSDIKALDQEKFSARELTGCMAPLLQKTSREQDKEMMQEIAKDFFTEKVTKRVTFPEIEEILKVNDLEGYIAAWKKKMYLKLLELYKIEYDQPFLLEMMNDPDFYGLTFEAYQMMTFEIEPSKPAPAKEEIHEEDKGPVFEEAEHYKDDL